MVIQANRWLVLVFLAVMAGQTQAEEVSLKGVPPPALAAVTANFPRARLVSARSFFEEDQNLYEVRCKLASRLFKIIVTPDGKILRRIQVLDVNHLPSFLRKAVEEQHAGYTIESAEMVTAQAAPSYQLVIRASNGKMREMELDPHGKVLSDRRMTEDKPRRTGDRSRSKSDKVSPFSRK